MLQKSTSTEVTDKNELEGLIPFPDHMTNAQASDT